MMALRGLLNFTHTILYGQYGSSGGDDGKSYNCGGPARVSGNDQAQMRQKLYGGFQMPLHYPRYKKEDYEEMEWKLDLLLDQYGLTTAAAYHHQGTTSLQEKRDFAIGAFVWPNSDQRACMMMEKMGACADERLD